MSLFEALKNLFKKRFSSQASQPQSDVLTSKNMFDPIAPTDQASVDELQINADRFGRQGIVPPAVAPSMMPSATPTVTPSATPSPKPYKPRNPNIQPTPNPTPSWGTSKIKAALATAGAKQFGSKETAALLRLIEKESSFNADAANPTSSARGLFQFLKSTAKAYGLPEDVRQAPLEKQIEAGLRYIRERYGTPSKALEFHNKNNFY